MMYESVPDRPSLHTSDYYTMSTWIIRILLSPHFHSLVQSLSTKDQTVYRASPAASMITNFQPYLVFQNSHATPFLIIIVFQSQQNLIGPPGLHEAAVIGLLTLITIPASSSSSSIPLLKLIPSSTLQPRHLYGRLCLAIYDILKPQRRPSSRGIAPVCPFQITCTALTVHPG